MGTRLPAHLIQYGSTVEDLVNLTAAGIVHATASRPEAAGIPPVLASR